MMSRINLFRNILLLGLAPVFFHACGNNDDTNSLRYRNSKYIKFEVYAGSDNGGVLVNKKVDSVRYFNAVMESFTDAMISFDANRILVGQVSISESSPYKFENGLLYIYNDGLWQYFGYGNTGNVTVRQNYVAYKQDGGTIQRFRGPSQEAYAVEEAVMDTPFKKLSGMENKADTLIVCTRDSYFK
ncbi:MAG: hypothetical protein LBL79_05580 [Prevotella sp.]|jgi:hypothetical protein|nr:hypothetical protein [Prevotella sp.]